jgi:hypothetical protein
MSILTRLIGMCSTTLVAISIFVPVGDACNKLLLTAICFAIWAVASNE